LSQSYQAPADFRIGGGFSFEAHEIVAHFATFLTIYPLTIRAFCNITESSLDETSVRASGMGPDREQRRSRQFTWHASSQDSVIKGSSPFGIQVPKPDGQAPEAITPLASYVK
jgi:hypothetical protein